MHFGECHFKTSFDKAAAMDDFCSPSNGMPSSDYIHPGDNDECWLDDDDKLIGAFPPKLSNYVDANALMSLMGSSLVIFILILMYCRIRVSGQ